MKPLPSYRKFLALAGSTSVFLSCLPAFAADATWNVNASGNWSVTSKWLPAAAPGATSGTTNTDTATFGSAILAPCTVTVDTTNRNLLGINFSGNSFGYTLITGNLLITNGGLIQSSGSGAAHTDTFSAPIVIQGTVGAATFTSGASINGSIMSLGTVTGVSTSTSTTLTLNGTNGSSSSASAITGAITNGGSGLFAIAKSGTGVWILSGANTFSGGVTLSDGTLKLGSTTALGTVAGTLTINGGLLDSSVASLTIANNNPETWNADFGFTGSNALNLGTGAVSLGTLAGTSRSVTVSANTLTIGGIISNGTTANSLIKAGAGTLVLSGANTFTGGVTLTGGTLKFGNNTAIGTSAGTLTINGGTFDTATGSVTFGNNPQIWNGDFTFTGSSNLTFGTGTISLGTAAGTSRSVTVSNNSLTIPGVISNGTTANSLIKAGTGTLVLSGANTFTGGVTLTDGTLKLGSTTALGTSAGTFTINGGALDSNVASLTIANNNPQTWNADFIFTGSNTLNLGNGAVSLGTLAGTSRAVTVSANTLTIGGIISNGTTANSLIKAGTGTLILSGANIFTGGVTLTAGTLKFGNATALGTTAGTFTINGGAFDSSVSTMGNYLQTWNGDFTYTGSTTLTFGTGAVSLGTAAGTSRTVTVSNNSLTIPGVISNGTTANKLIKAGVNGILLLSGANAYTGGTTVTGGELQFTTAGSVPNTGNLLVNGGALTIKNNNTGFSNSNTVTVQNGTLNISASSSNNQTLGGTGSVNTGPTITLGNAANLTDLTSTIAVTTSSVNLNNPINVVGKSSSSSVYNNVISVGNNPSMQAGAITLAGNGTTYRTNLKLDIVTANNGGGFGAVSGTGNVTVSVSANPFSTPAVGVLNNLGTVTVSGGGVAGSGATLNLTGLGSNVTGLSISSTAPTLSHPITISGANSTFTGDTTLASGAGFTQLTNTNALQNSVLNLVSSSFSFGSLTAASLGGLAGAPGVVLLNTTPAAVALTIGNSNSLNSASSNTLNPTYSGILSNTGSLIKVGSNNQTFTGASSYTGTTTLSGGTLTLGTGGSLGNTAITVGSTATLSVVAGRSAGNTATSAAGATLTLNYGSTLNLQDGTVGNFTVSRGATAAGTMLTLAGGTLMFDIGTSTGAVLSPSDTLVLNSTSAPVVASGSNIISVNTATATSLFLGATYNIITGGTSGLGTANYVISNPNASSGGTFYHFTVAGSGTQEVLTVAAGLVPTLLGGFWIGSESSSWAFQDGTTFKTNFSGVALGTSNAYALPDFNTNVTFTANTAANLSTTLNQNFTINSLTFSGTGTSNTAGSTIASGTGTNTLTLNAAALNGNVAGNGIFVVAGAGTDTITTNVNLALSQTWTNNSTNPLVVSGAVSESSAGLVLTKAGAGPLTLAGNNTYSGGTLLTSGTLNINSQGIAAGNSALGTGRLTLSSGTLNNTSAGTVDLSATTNNVQTWNTGSSIVFTGTSALNLGNGAVTFGNSAATDTITLTNNSGLAGTALTIGGAITPGTGGTAGVKTLAISGTGMTALTGIISNGTATAFNISVINAGNLTLSGTNSYTGSTTLSNGSLTVSSTGTLNNSNGISIGAAEFRYNSTTALSPAVTFSSTGGLLSGTGTITQAVTVPAGNSVAPGSGGIGILSFSGGLTIFGTYACDVSGVNSDKLAVVGNLNISTATLTVSGVPTAPSYTIASYTGTLTGSTFGAISPTIPAGYYVVVDTINKLILLQEGTYDTWAVVKGLTGANNGTLQDPDNDGIFNLLEYVLNGNPLSSSLSILPTVSLTTSNYIFTFNRRYESKDDTTQVFQYGTDLSGWTDIAIPATSSGSVTITANTPSAGIDLVTVTIPRAGNPILFGRLKVTKP